MYQLIFTDKALKSLKVIPSRDAHKILIKLEEFSKDPSTTSNVKKLRNHPIAVYRLRVGNYRVLFDKEDTLKIVEVIDIGHRKEIY
jgi:mRNA interferase RelE/StbE